MGGKPGCMDDPGCEPGGFSELVGVDVSKARGGYESAESRNRGRSILTTLGLSKTVGYDFRVMHPFYQAIGRHGFGNPVSLKGVALDGL